MSRPTLKRAIELAFEDYRVKPRRETKTTDFNPEDFKHGATVRFRTSGYEVANLADPDPAKEAQGLVNGDLIIGGGCKVYVPVWCERKQREATTIMVAISNVIEVRND
jgi:hypothetical protein